LLGELSDGEEDTTPQHTPSALSRTSSTSILDTIDPSKPWLHDFHAYLNSRDNLGDMTVVQWWGINSWQYPVWASLARDFLSVMATSVSSERAFSSAGITISKRRNLGHAPLNKHLHRIGKAESPLCPHSQHAEETIHHFLISCPFY